MDAERGIKMKLEDAIKATKKEYQNPQRIAEEDEVMKRYGYIFHPRNLDNLKKEDFKSFLLMKNNKHWEGIHRQ